MPIPDGNLWETQKPKWILNLNSFIPLQY